MGDLSFDGDPVNLPLLDAIPGRPSVPVGFKFAGVSKRGMAQTAKTGKKNRKRG